MTADGAKRSVPTTDIRRVMVGTAHARPCPPHSTAFPDPISTRRDLLRTLEGRASDAEYLVKIADNIPGGRTICTFGEACSWPVQSFVAKFKDEFIAKGKADEERRAKEIVAPVEGTKLAAAHH